MPITAKKRRGAPPTNERKNERRGASFFVRKGAGQPGAAYERSERRVTRSSESRYAYPFPNEIESVGRRHIRPFSPCDNCGTGTWVAYGPWLLCARCANLARPE